MALSGRFAPSPTGPLHMGSLVTAVASFADIKQRGGTWHVRIDNLDPPRQDPNAIDQIIQALNLHGLVPDTPVDLQADHQARFAAAFAKLAERLFYCNCSRAALRPHPVYPGTCRQRHTPTEDCAVRLRIDPGSAWTFDDALLGTLKVTPGVDLGDFIVKRRDGLWAYNFATAVDDGQDFTHILRGQDLLPTTAPQLAVMDALALTPPSYCHIPVLCFADGTKLSKQAHAPPLDMHKPIDNLRYALGLLGLSPPVQSDWTAQQYLGWATEAWSLDKIPLKLPPFVPQS